MVKPLFLTTRGERNILRMLDDDTRGIVKEYGHAAAEIYEWTVDEELNVPPHWIEECLYWDGSIGLGESKEGIPCFISGTAERRDIYGNAITWLPMRNRSTERPYESLKTKFKGDTNPLLRLPYTPALMVSEYCKIQYSSLLSMGQNAVGMRQPIVMTGQTGQIGVKLATNAIEGGMTYIPVASEEGATGGRDIEVLDLGVKNFLDPLTGVIDATDGWICQLLGIDAVGTQKASGITTEEAGSGDRRIKARRASGLKQRQHFVDKVNRSHPDIRLEVDISDEYSDETFYEFEDHSEYSEQEEGEENDEEGY